MVVAVAVVAAIATAIVVAAATTVNHAGRPQVKRKKEKGKSAVGTRVSTCTSCLFLFEPKLRRAFFLFAFLLLPFYFLASGLIFSVIRCPPRINSTWYSSPA